MASRYAIASAYQQEIDKLKGFGRDARARRTPLGIIECQSRRTLSRGLFRRELFQRIFAGFGVSMLCASQFNASEKQIKRKYVPFSPYVSWHADYELWHQAEDRVLCCMDSTSNVESPAVQNVQSRLRYV